MNAPRLVKTLAKRLGIYSSLRWYTPYNRRCLAFHKQFVRPGDMCIDVGANIGQRTEVYLQLGAKVIAVEPEPKCFAILQAKFANDRRVVQVNKGLSDAKGTGQLLVPSYQDLDGVTSMSSLSAGWAEAIQSKFPAIDFSDAVPVEITTLDDLIARWGTPNFCKIDVEGHEQSVLRGLSSPVPVVSFEYTPQRTEDVLACMKILESLAEYEYNYSHANSFEFGNATFLSREEFLPTVLPRIDSAKTFGDIYARVRAN
ncbi:MAG: FkbM family methyltransferase [Caldilineaceae bacterium]|nr:FkbM family methyltransferase [Caldilineaceae bacterium]